MSSFKPIDGSKEDFRKYLDRQGVMDAITKVLIKCNSDRPENAIEFLLENLGEKVKDKHTIACLETDLAEAKNEIEALKRQIESLQISVAAGVPRAEIRGSPVEEGALESVASEKASSDKEVPVVETVSEQDATAGGDVTSEQSPVELSEPVPKEQAVQ